MDINLILNWINITNNLLNNTLHNTFNKFSTTANNLDISSLLLTFEFYCNSIWL